MNLSKSLKLPEFKVSRLRKKNGEKIFINNVINLLDKFSFFFSPGDKILDLGCGAGMFTKILKSRGHTVTSIDVKNRSYYPDIKPIIYDGVHLPLKDKSNDVCLLIAVLHHTKQPEKVLKEALRVSKKIIILEDIYDNIFQKYYTYFIDSLLNKEFIGHPRSNKKDKEWKNLFNKLQLKVVKTEYSKAYGYLQNATYYLKVK